MKRDVRAILMQRQLGRCVVKGCPYDSVLLGSLDIHRITPGRAGGQYAVSNCVLVCRRHHKAIEGMSIQQIEAAECSLTTYKAIWNDLNRAAKHKILIMEREETRRLEEGMRTFWAILSN